MDSKIPKFNVSQHDLQALYAHGPRKSEGSTVSSRRKRERTPISSSDGRRRKTTGRNRQFNVVASQDLIDLVADTCERHDLTKAEFIERAVRAYVEALKRGGADAARG